MLVTRHRDQPGVLGRLGTLLGEHGVNIRRLELGPPKEGAKGLAWGFLTLYGEPEKDVVDAIAAMDDVEEVQLLRL